MNTKRLYLAIFVLFVAVFATNFLIHQVWLLETYKATASLWRTPEAMQERFVWMVLGQLLFATTFVAVWAAGFAEMQCVRCACLYGLLMSLFSQASTLVTYVVTPLPPSLAVKWFVAGVVQGVLMGLLVYWVYKPTPAESKPAAQRAGATAR